MSHADTDPARTGPSNSDADRGPGAARRPAAIRGRLLMCAVALIVLAALVYVGRRYFSDLARLGQANLLIVAAIAGVFVLQQFMGGHIMRMTLGALGHDITPSDAFLFSFVRAYSSILIPRSGLGTLGVLLKARFGVNVADYLSLLLPLMVVRLVAVGVIGGVALLVMSPFSTDPVYLTVGGTFVLVLLAGAAGILARVYVPASWQGPIGRHARRLRDSWGRIQRNGNIVWPSLGLQLVMVFLQAVELYLAFRAIGVNPGFPGVVVASALGYVVFVISVTPNGLGMREAAIVFAAAGAGVEPSVALAAALLDRVVFTVVIIVIAQFGIWRVIRRPRSGVDGPSTTRDAP